MPTTNTRRPKQGRSKSPSPRRHKREKQPDPIVVHGSDFPDHPTYSLPDNFPGEAPSAILVDRGPGEWASCQLCNARGAGVDLYCSQARFEDHRRYHRVDFGLCARCASLPEKTLAAHLHALCLRLMKTEAQAIVGWLAKKPEQEDSGDSHFKWSLSAIADLEDLFHKNVRLVHHHEVIRMAAVEAGKAVRQ